MKNLDLINNIKESILRLEDVKASVEVQLDRCKAMLIILEGPTSISFNEKDSVDAITILNDALNKVLEEDDTPPASTLHPE